MRERVGADLDVDDHRRHALAAFLQPRRAVALGRPQPPALPASLRIVDAGVFQAEFTGVPAAFDVAEELDADWSHVRVEHAPTAEVYHSPIFPIQMTGGSTTTWSELDRYRQVGAVARTLLVNAAAAQWGVPPADCRAEKGFILSGDKRASYGSLAAAAPDRVASTA